MILTHIAIRALPDLCRGIVSVGPGHLDPWIPFMVNSLKAPARPGLFISAVRVRSSKPEGRPVTCRAACKEKAAIKTRTPPQEKGGVLGNPHWHLLGEPEGSGELSRRIDLHSPDKWARQKFPHPRCNLATVFKLFSSK